MLSWVWHDIKWDYESCFNFEQRGFFPSVMLKPQWVPTVEVTNALFYPIPWNLRCFSLFSPPLTETECVCPSDDMCWRKNVGNPELVILKRRKTIVLFLAVSHLFFQCWEILTFTTFFLLKIVCYFIFRHEISCQNQLWVYNLCWAPTTEKNSFWGDFSGTVCLRLLPPQWSPVVQSTSLNWPQEILLPSLAAGLLNQTLSCLH